METEFNLESHLRKNGQLLESSFQFNIPGKDQEVMSFAFAGYYVRLFKDKEGKPLAMAVYSDSLYTNVRYYGAAPENPATAFVIFTGIVCIPKADGLPLDAGNLFLF